MSPIARFDTGEKFWQDWYRSWLLHGTVYAINQPEPRVVPVEMLTIHEGPCPAARSTLSTIVARAEEAMSEPLTAEWWHEQLAADPLLPDCSGTHSLGYAYCQRLAARSSHPDQLEVTCPDAIRPGWRLANPTDDFNLVWVDASGMTVGWPDTIEEADFIAAAVNAALADTQEESHE